MSHHAPNKLKILFVGPEGSGKSCLVNILADVTPGPNSNLPPCCVPKTVGCRILNFDETGTHSTGSDHHDDLVELWDCASSCPERSYPALKKGAVGVVICYNPESQNQIEDLDRYYENFSPRIMGLSSSAYMMCQITPKPASREFAIPQKISFAGIQNPLLTSYADIAQSAKPVFEKFLERVMKTVRERQRLEEDDVMRMG